MASITDTSYFVGELLLPNTDKQAGLDYYQIFIDEYENDYLRTLLGPDLFTAFMAGLALDPIPDQWTNLKNQIWTVNGAYKASPVANYIYFFIVRRSTYQNSGTGLVQNVNENSTPVSTLIECARAWNKCAQMSFQVYKFLKANEGIYGQLPYDLRFWHDDWLLTWFDWAYWWAGFPVNYRRLIPEIYQKLNHLGL